MSDRLLVANIGSTSFKFRLFEMPAARLLARGGVERIGSGEAPCSFQIGDSPVERGTGNFPDYAAAIRWTEKALADNGLGDFSTLAAVGFKPVMAHEISGTQIMDNRVLMAMEKMSALFPAHNPPYINAVRTFNELYPGLPCIGTFETAFYDDLPDYNRRIPVPQEWETEYGIRRTGFHGASHRFIAERSAELTGRDDLRIVSCHLGGSSSMAAIRNGKAVNSSWGMTAQSGLPHNNRPGDFDAFVIIHLLRNCGLELPEIERVLASESGMKGLSGLPTGDLRDITEAAANGNDNARLALDVFIASIRKFLGQFLVELDGIDLLVFTAGIGENNAFIRERVCADLTFCGLQLDPEKNRAALGVESIISSANSKIEVRVIPTNEEIVIARNAWRLLHP